MKKGMEKLLKLLNALFPVLLALLLGAVAIQIAGAKPAAVYSSIIKSALLNLKGLSNTLVYATPLIIIGAGLVLAFRGGIFNMGAEGQLYMGAFLGAYFGFTLEGLPSWLHILICLLGGMIGGMLWALIPALLRTYLHINELVSTIMLNYVATSICNYLTIGPFSYSYQYTSTAPVHPSAEMPVIFEGYTLTYGILVAVLVAILVWFIMKKTTFGYEIDMLGHQREFSEATGMNVRKRTMQIFLLSGALAGLAGATTIISVYKRFTPSFSANPGLGWDGMMVTMLGNSTPTGAVIAGILLGAFKFGGVSLQVKFGIPTEVIQIVQSSLMLFLSVRFIRENSKLFKWMTGLTVSRRRKDTQAGKEE